MLDKYKFNVIALTETWLQGKKYQQNYVQITECNTVFKNETDKWGGGVGTQLKENLVYKVQNDRHALTFSKNFLWKYIVKIKICQ